MAQALSLPRGPNQSDLTNRATFTWLGALTAGPNRSDYGKKFQTAGQRRGRKSTLWHGRPAAKRRLNTSPGWSEAEPRVTPPISLSSAQGRSPRPCEAWGGRKKQPFPTAGPCRLFAPAKTKKRSQIAAPSPKRTRMKKRTQFSRSCLGTLATPRSNEPRSLGLLCSLSWPSSYCCPCKSY